MLANYQRPLTVHSTVDETVSAFLDFALYYQNDENGVPLCVTKTKADLPIDLITQIYAEVLDFCVRVREVTKRNFQPDQLGVDFYFVRNRSATGFWDKPDIYGIHANQLQEIAETYSPIHLNL